MKKSVEVISMLIRNLIICLTMVCQNLYAVEIEHLFEAEIRVKNDQLQNRKQTTQQALKRVLDRIVAGDSINHGNIFDTLLADPEFFVSEYQYSLNESFAKAHHTRLLRILFDEQLLINTLRSKEVALWNEIRPKTLVWLVVEENGIQKFFDSNSMPEIDLALNIASKQKGLPILYPIQDLQEKRSLSIGDILSVYPQYLLKASQRYDVVSTLAGKIVKKENCWQAEWTFHFDSTIEQWKSQCSTVNTATLAGFQQVYEKLSAFYAAKPEKLTWLESRAE